MLSQLILHLLLCTSFKFNANLQMRFSSFFLFVSYLLFSLFTCNSLALLRANFALREEMSYWNCGREHKRKREQYAWVFEKLGVGWFSYWINWVCLRMLAIAHINFFYINFCILTMTFCWNKFYIYLKVTQ